jgi:ABC-type uncharacterized transport system fused permease/ATPase subunit
MAVVAVAVVVQVEVPPQVVTDYQDKQLVHHLQQHQVLQLLTQLVLAVVVVVLVLAVETTEEQQQ